MGTVKINTGYTPEEMKNSEWVGSGGGMPVKTPDRVTNNNVGRKTPEEIKKGLFHCTGDYSAYHCGRCAYAICGHRCDDKGAKLLRDALAYIQQLESLLAQVERERGALMHDFMIDLCVACKHDPEALDDCNDPCTPCKFEWRGVCPENTKEG